jgi:hypothetical protein
MAEEENQGRKEEEKERIFDRMLEFDQEEERARRIPRMPKIPKIPLGRIPLKVILGIIIIIAVCGTVVFLYYNPPDFKRRPAEEVFPGKETELPGVELTEASKGIGTIIANYTEKDGRNTTGHLFWPLERSGKIPGIIIVGREGMISSPELYFWLGEGLAREGYVSMLVQPTSESSLLVSTICAINGTWKGDIIDAIDFLTQESFVKDMVDENNIGLVGHSGGGMAVMGAAQLDERVKTVVVISKGDLTSVDTFQKPVQIITGEFDWLNPGIVPSIFEALPLYELANPPKQLIVVKSGTHLGFTSFLHSMYPRPSWQHETTLHYTTLWFDYWLKGKDAAREGLIIPVEGLSQAVESKCLFEKEKSMIANVPLNETTEAQPELTNQSQPR